MKYKHYDFVNFIFGQYIEREKRSDINEHGIQITPIQINKDYAKKWNVYLHDFVCIIKNDELLTPTLYRIGGIGTNKIKGKKYFMLLKYVEAFYSKSITNFTGTKDSRHLESRWCIIDQFGTEKVEFKQFESPYLVNDSCIYTIDSKYYNIETKKLYCQSFSNLKSKNYLFLENKYDDNKERIGVFKIDKATGEFELFK